MRSNVDAALNGFVEQLFSQRRHTAVMGPRGGALISDPATADTILRASDLFVKPSTLFWALGRNRFNRNGAEWLERRALTQQGYQRAGRLENRGKVAEVYRRRLAACETLQPTDIMHALLLASTEIFCDALGCQVAADPMLGFLDRVRELIKRVQYFSLVPPDPIERSALEQDAQLLIGDHQQEMARHPVLKALVDELQARGHARIDESHAVEELMMNAFAGVESTAATLGIAIDRLGAHPDVQEELAREASAGEAFSKDSCPKLECFIREIQRCYPSVPFIARQVAGEAEIEGRRMTPGAVVIISIVGVHRHPAYWSNPDRFDCARLEFVQDTYDRRAFIPFASGARVCGGAKLAQLELSEGLKAFIRRYVVEPGNEAISFDYAMAIRTKAWDQLRIAMRSGTMSDQHE
jgi:cytochrome P450